VFLPKRDGMHAKNIFHFIYKHAHTYLRLDGSNPDIKEDRDSTLYSTCCHENFHFALLIIISNYI
jgi:hypothetical protein